MSPQNGGVSGSDSSSWHHGGNAQSHSLSVDSLQGPHFPTVSEGLKSSIALVFGPPSVLIIRAQQVCMSVRLVVPMIILHLMKARVFSAAQAPVGTYGPASGVSDIWTTG